jgi:hypothetical protein
VIKKAGVAAPIAAYAGRADESLAFDASLSADASRAAVVWDDDTPSGERKTGGITVAVAPLGGGQPLASRIVSGDTAEPDGPRLLAREPKEGGGWWVAWMAHRPELLADAAARPGAAVAEAPAEDRSFTWIEVIAIGDDGAPAGPPRRITSATGHAGAFDLAPHPHGGLDVLVRDETQLREGEGGRILHVVVSADGRADEPAVIVPAGVGRGAIDVVLGATGAAWLAYSDAQDRTLLVPLGPGRSALGAASIEDALEGGRFLTVAGEGALTRFTAAFPGADGPLFREVACAP